MTAADRLTGRVFVFALPLVGFAASFGPLYLTYLAAAMFVPDMLGEVADRPATYAALVAVVAVPVSIALLPPVAWRSFKALLTGSELPPVPHRTGWRRVAWYLVGLLPDVAAALIVVGFLADPHAASPVPPLAVSVLGPIALYCVLRGLGVLRRRGWRRFVNRGYRPRHAAAPDQERRPAS